MRMLHSEEQTDMEDAAFATLRVGCVAAVALESTQTIRNVSAESPIPDVARLGTANSRRIPKAIGITTSRPSQRNLALLLLFLLLLASVAARPAEHNQLLAKGTAKIKCKKWSSTQENTPNDGNHSNDDDGGDVHYPCTAGFSHYHGSCYLIIPPSKTILRDRSTAWSECASSGGHLVAIESRGEQRYLQNVLNYYHHNTVKHGAYWTGAHVDARGRWRWDVGNGRKTRAMRFNDWAGDESSWAYELAAGPSGPAHCGLLDPADDYRWMFWPCDSSQFPGDSTRSIGSPIGAICEKPRMESRWQPPCSGDRGGSRTGRSSSSSTSRSDAHDTWHQPGS